MMKFPEPDPDAKGIPAATVIIFRNALKGGPAEVLMVTRAENMRFAGGAAVFPGGKVDPADQELARALAPDRDTEDTAARIAGVRETLEETGLMIGLRHNISVAEVLEARRIVQAEAALGPALAHFGWELDLDSLVPFARWHPKVKSPKIFDARFYLADLGTGNVDIAIDQTENTHLFWVSAAEALAMADREEVSVIFPTRRNLERLAQFASFADARAHALAHPVRMITPWVDNSGEVPVLRIPDDLGYPVTSEPLATIMRALPAG